MFRKLLILLIAELFAVIFCQQKEPKEFLDDYNKNFISYMHADRKAAFTNAVNLTYFNSKQEKLFREKYQVELSNIRNQAQSLNFTKSDEDTKRQFRLLLQTKQSSNRTVSTKIQDLHSEMKDIYGKLTIPFNPVYIKSIHKKRSLNLEEIKNIMATSNNSEELSYVWKNWRNATSTHLRNRYEAYVTLNNIGARQNGFQDAGEYYRSFYEVEDLKKYVDELWKEMQPFYLELHGFIRHHLRSLYPNLVNTTGTIPADLVGDISAQSFGALYERIKPYSHEPSVNITPTLQLKDMKPEELILMAEDFFTSLGWKKLPKTFWEKSIFVRQKDQKMDCRPITYDLTGKICNKPDVRMKMCIEGTLNDIQTIFHHMGSIYYYLFYSDQPLPYRRGANPSFHEAVGDFISLSANTPDHLKNLGLLEEASQTKQADINFLLKMSLEKMSSLPFAIVMSKWMWDVYSGEIKPSEYNSKWWEYREKYQGISNPVVDNMTDLDPVAVYPIAADLPYIRYIFSSFLMFVFHKRACELSNNTKPLHQCSIYKSEEAGKEIGEMLAQGRRKPWPEVLKQFTGSENISSEPVKEYFRPLMQWLKDYRSEHNYELGWNDRNGSLKEKPIVCIIVIVFLAFLEWSKNF